MIQPSETTTRSAAKPVLPRLCFKRRAEEQFKALPDSARDDLDRALLRLKADPETAGIELLGRLRGTWRLREGGYRVLYKIADGGKTVVVVSIRIRPQAYQRRRR